MPTVSVRWSSSTHTREENIWKDCIIEEPPARIETPTINFSMFIVGMSGRSSGSMQEAGFDRTHNVQIQKSKKKVPIWDTDGPVDYLDWNPKALDIDAIEDINWGPELTAVRAHHKLRTADRQIDRVNSMEYRIELWLEKEYKKVCHICVSDNRNIGHFKWIINHFKGWPEPERMRLRELMKKINEVILNPPPKRPVAQPSASSSSAPPPVWPARSVHMSKSSGQPQKSNPIENTRRYEKALDVIAREVTYQNKKLAEAESVRQRRDTEEKR